jgi:uncharacterized protein (DUF1800 family)
MTRRAIGGRAAVFGVALIAACAPAARAPEASATSQTASSPASSEREQLPDEQVQHVLNRLAFGGRPGDAAAIRAMGVDRWIQRQLHPEKIDDARSDSLVARFPALASDRAHMVSVFTEAQQARNRAQRQLAAVGDTSVDRRDARMAVAMTDPGLAKAQRLVQRAVPELQAAILTRAVASERQLNEVMVSFWENHFSVFSGKGQQERLFLVEYDRDVIRPNALGKFRTLLGAVAHSPAMLFYLDNARSQADSAHPTLAEMRLAGRPRLRAQLARRPRRGLNENYARELLELHTLGVDGGYSQRDVIEVARALTGWTIAIGQGGGFVFRPEAHDAGEKLILGKKFPAGRGEDEGEAVLDLVARHPATARFITAKLARQFISDDPPASVIDRCSAVFTRTDGDIRETLGCVITGPEFFSRAAYRAKVKTPFQVVASALRAIGAVPDATPRSAQLVAQLGQPIFGHQTPEGWPDRAEAWMNTGAILNRINFGLTLAGGRVPGLIMTRLPEVDALRSAPREAQVDGVVKLFFGGQVSPDTRDVLLSGDNPLASKSDRPAVSGLAQVIGLALGAPEFQRR